MDPLRRLREFLDIESCKSMRNKEAAIQGLRECLREEETLQKLDSHSKAKNSSITWHDVFRNCHAYLLQIDAEVEDEERKGLVATLPKKKFRETVSTTVGFVASKANRDLESPNLKLSSMLTMCFEMLTPERWTRQHGVKNVGTLYLTILANNVMACPPYWQEMSLSQWQDLLDHCMELFAVVQYPDNDRIVKIMECIASRGSSQSSVAIHLKSKLDFFENIFNLEKLDELMGLQESLLKLYYAIVTALALECRLALCKLGEIILPRLIRLHSKTRGETEKRQVLYKLLLTLVSLHHPGGAPEGSEFALAHDWTLWQQLLTKLQCFVEEEVCAFSEACSRSQRSKGSTMMPDLNSSLLELAIEVYNQTLKRCEVDMGNTSSMDSGGHAKRRRLQGGLGQLITQIHAAQTPEDIMIKLNITACLIKKYPAAMMQGDHLDLLQTLVQILSTCKNSFVMTQLFRCFESLLASEGSIDMDRKEEATVSQLWNKVWDMTLRAAGLNQCEESCHSLLQALLLSPRGSSMKLAPLFQLLRSGVARSSTGILRTLSVLANQRHLHAEQEIVGNIHSSIPDSNGAGLNNGPSPFVETLLRWLIPARDPEEDVKFSSNVANDVMAETIVRLTITSGMPETEVPTINTPICSRLISRIEQVYCLKDTSSIKPMIVQKLVECVQVCPETFQLMLDVLRTEFEFIMEKLANLCQGTNSATRFTVVLLTIHTIGLFSHILSYLLTWNIVKEANFSDCELTHHLTELLSKLPTSVARTLNLDLPGCASKHSQILEGLRRIYSARLHSLVGLHLRTHTSSQLLDTLLNIMQTPKPRGHGRYDDDDTGFLTSESSQSVGTPVVKGNKYSILSESGLNTGNKKQLAATKVLSSYWFTPGLKQWPSQDQEKSLIFLECIRDLANRLEKVNLLCVMQTLDSACMAETLNPQQTEYVLDILKPVTIRKSRNQNVAQRILDILGNMMRHIDNDNFEDPVRKVAISTLNGFTVLIGKGLFGAAVHTCLVNCLGKCIAADPDQTYLLWPKKDEGTTPIVADILEYLKSPYHEVRLSATKWIKELFCTVATSWDATQYCNWHRFVFDKLCLATMTSFDCILNKGCPDTRQDDLCNLTTTVLHSFCTVIQSCPQWRKKALFAIFQLAKLRQMNSTAVRKSLVSVSNELQVPNIQAFLGANLNFLLTQWLNLEYSFEEFPWVYFECNSAEEFMPRFKAIVIPTLVQCRNESALEFACNALSLTLKDVMEECFPMLLSHLLPIISKCPQEVKSGETSSAKANYKSLVDVLEERRIEELMMDNLEKIIVCLFQLLHDPAEWQGIVGADVVINIPDPDPPHFTLTSVIHTLNHMQTLTDQPDTPLLVFSTGNSPSYIQTILQQLKSVIYQAPTQEDRLKAFFQYAMFVKLLTNYFDSRQFSKVIKFIIRDTIYTLLNLLLTSNHSTLAIAVCSTLQIITCQWINNDLENFQPFLPRIISALVTVLKKDHGHQFSVKAISVIEFIVVENRDVLKKVIEKLDPFPNGEKFQQLQTVFHEVKYGMQEYSLEDEIEHFLNAGTSGQEDRTEGLVHLRSQLSSRKPELKRMYSHLTLLRGFSEECELSVLHKLISELVRLASSGSQEAAQCLGELGPCNLTTLILKPEQRFDANDPHMAMCTTKINHLLDYIVDPDHCVATTASEALYSLLQTKEGLTALNNLPCKDFLIPFVSVKGKAKSVTPTIREHVFVENLDENEIWCPSVPCDYRTWLSSLVCSILDTISYSPQYLEQLKTLCRCKENFASELLPCLVYIVLASKTKMCALIVCKKIDYFFARHYEVRGTAQSSQESVRNILVCLDKKSVRCMLNVVQFVRIQEHGFRPSQKLLSHLNYLHVAHAALFCSSYFSSIFYAELWGMERKSAGTDRHCTRSIDEVCDSSEEGKALHEILLQSYKNIGDPDAVYGCGMSRLLDPQSRMWYFEHCNKWDRVMLMQDMGVGAAPRGMAMSLQQSGLHQLLRSYLGVQQQSEEVKAMQYECCWRLGQWDMPTSSDQDTVGPYEVHHYAALNALRAGNFVRLQRDVEQARRHVMQSLVTTSLESSMNVYESLSKLQSLQEVADFSHMMQTNRFSIDVMEKWKQQDEIPAGEFQYVEPILSQRACLIGIALKMDDFTSEVCKEAQAKTLLSLAETARRESRFQVAERALHQLTQGSELQMLRKCVEEAQCLWEQGDHVLGRHLLASVMPKLAGQESSTLHASALKLCGNWMVETRSENAHTIISDYFIKAIKILRRVQQEQTELAGALRTLAQFADAEFKRIDKYMHSPMFESKMQCMQKAAEAAKTLRKEASQTKDMIRAINVNDKQSRLDRSEIDNITAERDQYLRMALQYHINSLQCAGAAEDEGSTFSTMFRVVALWLDNRAQLHQEGEKLRSFLENALDRGGLPSHTFLAVIPQLVPHINVTKERFDACLATLLERLAEDHPHHVLPTLLAVSMTYEDAPYLKMLKPAKPEARVLAAKAMLTKLRKKPALTTIMSQMETAAEAFVQFAYYQASTSDQSGCDKSSNEYNIPTKMLIRKVNDFDQMQVSTLNLPGNRAAFYNVVGIQSYGKKFYLVGGINAPKKIICTGTDGVKRTQLLKGQDDLHQDSVMQQVFTIMNSLLRKNEQTQKRRLLVRTYKVVPLSQRSGILEWCNNTQPIGEYLLKAHPMYRPKDDPLKKCKERISECQRDTNENRLQVYLDICNKLRPVFHNFFMENFPQPGVWFERRLAYIRSVATTSMIGYILGLGDRHVQNILIDKKTAEVIHIDFGIAFEQGLVLNVPETVPFRLTRDIEDGLGVSGVEGVFRRSCEATMSVLRESQEMLLTILQVLLYDPLYVWTISPERNDNNRRGLKGSRDAAAPEVEVNKIAERALLRLQQKLMGTEEGTPTSVSGQVNRLIQESRDPVNLSRLFFGWQAYL